MRTLLVTLLNIAQRTGRFTVVEATAVYNGLWRIIGLTLLACVAALMMNAWLGLKTPSLMLAIVFAVAAIYLWAKPLHILVVGGVGLAIRIINDATLADEIENALRTYLGFLKWVLLAGITFLFITGTVSFKGNPGAILPIFVGLGVIGLFTWMWPNLFVGTWGRKLVYGYAVIVVAYSFLSLVPGATLAKYTGWFSGLGGDGHRQTRAQARAEQPPQKRMLSIPAGGDTRVSVPSGHGAAFTGHGFDVLCFYTDESEDVGTPTHPCKNEPMVYQIVRDTSGQPNVVMYELVQGAR